MSDIFIGRQPIYERNLEVYAYELLFRGTRANAARFSDGDQATSSVIVNTFMEIGLDNIVSQQLAFINLTRAFFVDQGTGAICLPRDRVVLELLEHIEADADVLEGVRRLSAQGYTIALDDFVFHERLRPLVRLADIVKVDVMAMDDTELRRQVRELRRHPLKLVAEKVETKEAFDFCLDLGFDYFQGYFFAQPQVIRGQRLPSNRLSVLNLLGRLQDPALTPARLVELIEHDTTFSPRILGYVSSASPLSQNIESIAQAVAALGPETVKAWVTLLALSKLHHKPAELLVTAMVRAKMAEALGRTLNTDHPESFFTVGLFSALDALMDNDMQGVLTQLPLAAHISDALLHYGGVHGEVLKCVLAYERSNWEQIRCERLRGSEIRDCYLAALRWAGDTNRQLIQRQSS
ncbi:MAG: EAL domain-containing protein [Gammaproteobacteria bacterium]|jgi:EAL and modified HD-GYP domain-containing signal transduction protein